MPQPLLVILVVLGLLASVGGAIALIRSRWMGSKLVGVLGIASIVAYVAIMLAASILAELDAKKKALDSEKREIKRETFTPPPSSPCAGKPASS